MVKLITTTIIVIIAIYSLDRLMLVFQCKRWWENAEGSDSVHFLQLWRWRWLWFFYDDDDDDYDGDGDSGGEYFDGQSTQEAMVIDNSAELCHDLHVLQMPQNNV